MTSHGNSMPAQLGPQIRPPRTSLIAPASTLPLAHWSASLWPSLCPGPARFIPGSGPLHVLFLLLGILFALSNPALQRSHLQNVFPDRST